eukprot:6211225-Pleurochrysis_carterae.AAC.1
MARMCADRCRAVRLAKMVVNHVALDPDAAKQLCSFICEGRFRVAVHHDHIHAHAHAHGPDATPRRLRCADRHQRFGRARNRNHGFVTWFRGTWHAHSSRVATNTQACRGMRWEAFGSAKTAHRATQR